MKKKQGESDGIKVKNVKSKSKKDESDSEDDDDDDDQSGSDDSNGPSKKGRIGAKGEIKEEYLQ